MKHNKNIDEIVTKILKESLEDKVIAVTKNIKRKLQESVCEECGKEICECSNMEEEMKEEDKTNACETYKYHLENFGEDDERTQEFKVKCGEDVELDEELHGNQHKLDVAKPKGKLTSADFKKLRGETDESECSECGSGYMEESETEEGNAFTGALVSAKKKGKDSFEVDGKKYQVKESNKKNTLSLTENELIDLIESIVNEQKAIDNNKKGETKNQKTNIKKQTPKGLQVYEKVHGQDNKQNDDYIKSVAKKFKEYLKNGSKGEYDMNPKHFPKGNGELAKMSKKSYVPSEAVDEYVDAFAYPGQTNLRYDEIKPNDDRIKKQLEGDPTMGNSQEYANAVKSDVGKKFKKNYDENLYGAEQADASYKRFPAPVDVEGETTQSGSLKSKKSSTKKAKQILNKLESVEDRKNMKLTEEFQKITKLMNYSNKTQ